MVSRKWEFWNALIMLLGTALVLAGQTSGWLMAMSVISFSAFVWLHYDHVSHFKPLGGYANLVTALRFLLLTLVFLLLDSGHFLFAVFFVLILCLDGLDGYLARRFNTASSVGGHFDMEVDAFFVLAMGISLFEKDQALWWVLLIGLWRYLYVLCLFFSKLERAQEPVSYAKKTVTVVAIGSLIWALFFFNEWSRAALLLSAIVISLSFLHSLYFHFSRKWIAIP